MILISHDRYLMDRVVNHLLVFDEHAHITPFQGNYSDYMDMLKNTSAPALREKNSNLKSVKDSAESGGNRVAKEIKQIEKEIAQLELKKVELESVFVAPGGTPGDYAAAGKMIKTVSEELDGALARWEALAEME